MSKIPYYFISPVGRHLRRSNRGLQRAEKFTPGYLQSSAQVTANRTNKIIRNFDMTIRLLVK